MYKYPNPPPPPWNNLRVTPLVALLNSVCDLLFSGRFLQSLLSSFRQRCARKGVVGVWFLWKRGVGEVWRWIWREGGGVVASLFLHNITYGDEKRKGGIRPKTKWCWRNEGKTEKKKRKKTPCKLINLHGKAFNMDNIKRFFFCLKPCILTTHLIMCIIRHFYFPPKAGKYINRLSVCQSVILSLYPIKTMKALRDSVRFFWT